MLAFLSKLLKCVRVKSLLSIIPIICILFCSIIGLFANKNSRVLPPCHKSAQEEKSHSDCPVVSKSYTVIIFKDIIQNKLEFVPHFFRFNNFKNYISNLKSNFLNFNFRNMESKILTTKLLL